MNNKNLEITTLIQWLKNKYTELKIKDYWDADLTAIGVSNKKGTRLLYISSFNQTKGKFYIECEKIDNHENYTVFKKKDNLSKEGICDILDQYIFVD